MDFAGAVNAENAAERVDAVLHTGVVADAAARADYMQRAGYAQQQERADEHRASNQDEHRANAQERALRDAAKRQPAEARGAESHAQRAQKCAAPRKDQRDRAALRDVHPEYAAGGQARFAARWKDYKLARASD